MPKTNSSPKVVLFDLDNTLYPYTPAHQAGLKAVADKLEQSLGVVKVEALKFYDLARQQIKNSLGKTGSSHNRLLYFQRLLELLEVKSQPLLALDLEQTYWREYLNNMELFPVVQEFLEELKVRRIPTALITDLTAQIQFKKLVWLELDHSFDAIVTSEEAGADKPDPRAFKLAMQKLKLETKDIWMIGDSIETDLVGAKQALNATTWLRSEGLITRPSSEVVDHVFNSFDQLLLALNQEPASSLAS